MQSRSNSEGYKEPSLVRPVSSYFLTDHVLEYVARGRSGGGAYFEDGIRKVHYVLVLTRASAYNYFPIVNEVISKLEDLGLDFEQDLGITIPAIFIKIHISDEVSEQYLHTFDIQQEFLTDYNYADSNPERFTTFKTPVTFKNVFTDVTAASLTNNKIKIITRMLKNIPYGPEEDMRGIDKLHKKGIFQDHYALHDGKIQIEYWHNDDLLNERTLLAKYWANLSVWYKQQPLDLIHKYYGAEVAFFYAWSDFYNKVFLVPVAIIGVILTIYNVIRIMCYSDERLNALCKSKEMLCGLCIRQYGCSQLPLKNICYENSVLDFLEGSTQTGYTLLSSLYALVFYKLWQRREFILRRRWNLLEDSIQEEIEIRLEYKDKSKRVVVNNTVKYIFDKRERCLRIFSLIVCYIGLVIFLWAFIYFKQALCIYIKIQCLRHTCNINIKSFLPAVNSTLQAIFTIVFSKFAAKIGAKMTNMIYPRTQASYDKILIFVTFTLDLCNNFNPLIHTAFLKALNFNIPYDTGIRYLRYDSCDPGTCLVQLHMQFMIYLTLKTFLEKIFVVCYPKIKKIIKSHMKEQLQKSDMPQYEEEYNAKSTSRSIVSMHFSKRTIQYGMVLSFIYSFPLAPLCILIHNVLALRMDAGNLVRETRRPASVKQVTGIGVWDSVIFYMTLGSSLCNIFFCTLVGHAIDNNILHTTHEHVKYESYSLFDPSKKFGVSGLNKSHEYEMCLYRDFRYPSGHIYAHEPLELSYIILYYKYWIVVALEIFVMGCYILMVAIIPTVPLSVKKSSFVDRTNLDNKYNKIFNKKLEIIRPDQNKLEVKEASQLNSEEDGVNVDRVKSEDIFEKVMVDENEESEDEDVDDGTDDIELYKL